MKEPPETEDKFSEEWRGLTLHCCRVAWWKCLGPGCNEHTGLSGNQAAVYVLVCRAASWRVELLRLGPQNKAPKNLEQTQW